MNNKEKFEKHIKEVLGLCIDIGVDGEYESDRTRENWLTWQAATAESSTQLEQDLVYEAWRNSEAYQVPMTELGQKIAEQRYYGFQKGWEYAKFYEKHKHVDMKSFLENYY